MTMTSLGDVKQDDSELEEGEIPDDPPKFGGFSKDYIHTFLKNSVPHTGSDKIKRHEFDKRNTTSVTEVILSSDGEYQNTNNSVHADNLSAISADELDDFNHKKPRKYQNAKDIMTEIGRTVSRRRHRRSSWRDLKNRRYSHLGRRSFAKCKRKRLHTSSDSDEPRGSRNHCVRKNERSDRDFDKRRKEMLEKLSKSHKSPDTNLQPVCVNSQQFNDMNVDMSEDSDMFEDCPDAAELAVIETTPSLNFTCGPATDNGGGGGEEEEEDLTQLRLLALKSKNKVQSPAEVDERMMNQEAADDNEDFKNEFLLRAEALKTAVLKKHSVRRQKQSPIKGSTVSISPESDSISENNMAGTVKRALLQDLVDVKELTSPSQKEQVQTDVACVTDLKVFDLMEQETFHMENTLFSLVEKVPVVPILPNNVTTDCDVSSVMNTESIKSDGRTATNELLKVEAVSCGSAVAVTLPLTVESTNKFTHLVPCEDSLKLEQPGPSILSGRRKRRRSRKSERREEHQLRSQLLNELLTKKKEKVHATIKNQEMQLKRKATARKSEEGLQLKTKATAARQDQGLQLKKVGQFRKSNSSPVTVPNISKTLAEPPRVPAVITERIIVHLGDDSSDEDDELAGSKRKRTSVVPASYEKSVELLLSRARSTVEMKMKIQKMSESSESSNGVQQHTPEAVYKHLPPSQRLEYIRLKQKIAEKEKLKKPNQLESQGPKAYITLKNSPKKPLVKKSLSSHIQKNSEEKKLEAIKQRNRQLKIDNLKVLLKKIRTEKIIEEKYGEEMRKLRNQMNLVEKKKNQQKLKIRKMVDDSKAIYQSIQLQDDGKKTGLGNTGGCKTTPMLDNGVKSKTKVLSETMRITQSRRLSKDSMVVKSFVGLVGSEQEHGQQKSNLTNPEEHSSMAIQDNTNKLAVIQATEHGTQSSTSAVKQAQQKQIEDVSKHSNVAGYIIVEPCSLTIKKHTRQNVMEVTDQKYSTGGARQCEQRPVEDITSKHCEGVGQKPVDEGVMSKCCEEVDESPEEDVMSKHCDGVDQRPVEEGTACVNKSSAIVTSQLRPYQSPLQPVVGRGEIRVNPNIIMCQFDLTGTCRDEECAFQHCRTTDHLHSLNRLS